MRIKTIVGISAIILTAGPVAQWVLGAGAATAAQAQSAEPEASAKPDGETPAGTADAEPAANNKNREQTPAQQVEQMDYVRKAVQKSLAAARSKRDLVKEQCLDDKLNRIDVTYAEAKKRLDAYQSAVDVGAEEDAAHEKTILDVMAERSAQIGSEAQRCFGKEAGAVGESSNSSTPAENLPDESQDEAQQTTISQLPNCTSCYK